MSIAIASQREHIGISRRERLERTDQLSTQIRKIGSSPGAEVVWDSDRFCYHRFVISTKPRASIARGVAASDELRLLVAALRDRR